MSADPTAADQRPEARERHGAEIQESFQHWDRKPVLQEIYREFYRRIASQLAPAPGQPNVEIGSGMGKIKEILPDCITTDIHAHPWLDRQENIYRLSFPDRSVANYILFDVWHHLEYPAAALRELQRTLAPGGRVVLLDPAMGMLGLVVFGLFHHEPVGLRTPLLWEMPSAIQLATERYFAAQSSASRTFWWKSEPGAQLTGWRTRRVQVLPALDYVLSGGLRGPCLITPRLRRFIAPLNGLLAILPHLTGTRLLVVLEKEAPSPPPEA